MLYRLHAILLSLTLALSPALASQNSLFSPTTGTVSGLNLTNNYNNAIDSVNTCNSGASAPTNQLSGSASLGNCWWNTSTNKLAYNDGSANWLGLGWFDTVNHYWQALVGGGALNNIASSATTDLCAQNQYTVNVTGTTTITSFGSNCQVGQVKHVVFTGILTLTHNGTSLILPNNGNNINTAAGDVAEATYLGSGNWRVTDYVLASGQPLNTSAVAVVSSSLTSSAQGFNAALNLRLAASIGSNALTISILGTNGSNPSAANPVLIGFRDATLATGDMVVDSLQSALSFTIASGNTMGASNTVPFRLWVFAMDNAGTVVLGAVNCSSPTAIYQCAEDQLQNSASGTSGGSSAGVFYASASALSGKAIRILGYLEYSSGLTTAGTWNALPTKIQLFGPGINKPGDLVQQVFLSTGSTTTLTSSFSVTSLSQSIIPSSTVNLVDIDAQTGITPTPSGGGNIQYQVSRGSGPTFIGQTAGFGVTGSNGNGSSALVVLDAPATTSAQTYTVYGKTNASTSTAAGGTIRLREIMGLLKPANGNRKMSEVG